MLPRCRRHFRCLRRYVDAYALLCRRHAYDALLMPLMPPLLPRRAIVSRYAA